MRTRDYVIVFVCLAATAGLLYAAGAQLDYINGQRQALKLVINAPTENMPPSLAFATVAMGAFRGLIVDILWMRADKLKEEGQFFDARQLAEWITKLQPRFAAVWEFQAWNMAYNISVAIPATQPEQRWRWVKNGYELLRDEGHSPEPQVDPALSGAGPHLAAQARRRLRRCPGVLQAPVRRARSGRCSNRRTTACAATTTSTSRP